MSARGGSEEGRRTQSNRREGKTAEVGDRKKRQRERGRVRGVNIRIHILYNYVKNTVLSRI
jgi:hypothetical protein